MNVEDELPWILTIEKRPSIGSNVEYSEDGITVEGTMDYTDERDNKIINKYKHRQEAKVICF